MEECYLCGSHVHAPGPPVCGPCVEMVSRGSHGLSMDGPFASIVLEGGGGGYLLPPPPPDVNYEAADTPEGWAGLDLGKGRDMTAHHDAPEG